MAKFYVGDSVAYQNERKEWKIVKAELKEAHGEEFVEYTIEKVEGQNLGTTKAAVAEELN